MKLNRIFLLIFFIIFVQSCYSQKGFVTSLVQRNDSLILTCDKDKIIIGVCKKNILMINYLENGKEDSTGSIIFKNKWEKVNAKYFLESERIEINTGEFEVLITKKPFRFSILKNERLLSNEPDEKGIYDDEIDLKVTGKNFYGIGNRYTGSLASNSGGTVTAGEQGHAGAPFIWTNEGYGILFDANGGKFTLKNSELNFSKGENRKSNTKMFILTGTPNEIFSSLSEITGRPPLFPKWSLGFMNSEWGIDENELLQHVKTYRSKNIPIDAFIFDFDWMDWSSDNYGEFRFGPKFPDALGGKMKKMLDSSGIKLLGIRKPRVHLETIQGRYADSNGFFLKYETDYFSNKKVGLLNFHKSEVQKWYWDNFIEKGDCYNNGIIGYWNDEADVYGGNFMFTDMQKAQYEGQRKLNNNRVFSINRNFYTGNQKYAYCLWSGDIHSGYKSMAAQRLFMLSSVNVGASWWSMDIGGFKENPNNENYYRWIQFGTFIPIFRVHGSFNHQRQPWFYGEEAESIAKKYIRLRYELMPYIYSYAWLNHNTGISISKPLLFNYPADPKVENLFSEFLFGDEILVSPIVTDKKDENLNVYLPEGEWYNYWTGLKYPGNSILEYKSSEKDIPIFIKAGAIIPTQNAGQYVDDPKVSGTLIINCYAGRKTSFTLYDDDGTTYNYEKGECSIITFSQNSNDSKRELEISNSEGNYRSKSKNILIKFLQVDSKPINVSVNNDILKDVKENDLNEKSGWAYNKQEKVCFVKIPFDNLSKKVKIQF